VSGNPYLDARSGVFRNRLGLTDRAELATAEKRFTAARISQLKRRHLPGRYDLDHLRAFHWTIFQDVYPWAGQLRTVLIVKAGASFCLPHQIVDTAADVFGRLAAADHLRAVTATGSWPASRRCSPRSTPCTRSARATDAPSALSCPSSPATPASG
jgi:cell filamentation protein